MDSDEAGVPCPPTRKVPGLPAVNVAWSALVMAGADGEIAKTVAPELPFAT